MRFNRLARKKRKKKQNKNKWNKMQNLIFKVSSNLKFSIKLKTKKKVKKTTFNYQQIYQF